MLQILRRAVSVPASLRTGFIAASLLGSLFYLMNSELRAADDGVKVPDGFTVTEFADDKLAHDIFSMTIDSLGRVVVSGPGYVKILVDTDGDGKADQAKQFAEGPASGAQGMCFLGRDLLCTGDAGLIRYKDENADDKADGEPELFLKIKTGGEHNAHAIRRGPDGWWYLIAGNTAEITRGYVTSPKSPVSAPYGGVVMRLQPDLSGGEVLSDGLRNAYDFDFDANGELYTHDSDGERDLSLPWYVPTRLFHLLPGANYGSITDSWKQPDYFLDAPPTVASTGRGSPTGVACYRHTQFPEQYQGALFLLDWTFGRVLALPLQRKHDTWTGKPVEFISARGHFGFAPTDLDVGPDGSLYICVGGRGTHGTVYRVTYTGGKGGIKPPKEADIPESATLVEKRDACLNAFQPLSSWARVRWMPVAKTLGAQVFLSAALDDNLTVAARIRAIEILTEMFDGLPHPAAEMLARTAAPEVRARAAWSLGVKRLKGADAEILVTYLNDTDPLVRRRALEASFGGDLDSPSLIPAVARCLDAEHRQVRLAAARLIPQMSATSFKTLSETARRLSWKAALTNALGFIWRMQKRDEGFNAYAIDIGTRMLEGNYSPELKLEAIRTVQIALGDLGSSDKLPPVFDGFAGWIDLTPHERELDPLRISLAKLFPTGDRLNDLEISRTLAMLTPVNADLLNKVLEKLTEESHPVDDLHYLIVAARVPVERDAKQRATIARTLVNLESKLVAHKLQKDISWNERINELYTQLVKLDAELPAAVLAQSGFGRPGHVIFLSKVEMDQFPDAVAAFAKAIAADADYPWNNDVVFVLGMSNDKEHLKLIRKQFEKFELRMAVLMVLAASPEEEDRARFAEGLEFAPMEIQTACVESLEKLSAKRNGEELVALIKMLRRLGAENTEYPLREQVVSLLKRNMGQDFDFEFGPGGYHDQPEVIEKFTKWAAKEYPAETARLLGAAESDVAALGATLGKVAWDKGDATRGAKLWVSRGCAQCHSGGTGLGPDLAGAAARFSRDDLFIAVAFPNLDVSPRYQTTLIETKAGKTYTGLIVYESVEGLLLRNGTNQTFRIESSDIEAKRTLATSLMPGGLLKDLRNADLADLYSYLKTLNLQTADQKPDRTKD